MNYNQKINENLYELKQNSINFRRYVLFLFFLCLFAISCTTKQIKKTELSFLTLDESYCSPPIYKGLSTGAILKSNTNLALTNDSLLSSFFTEQSRLILHGLNLTDEVIFLLENRKDTTFLKKVKEIETRNKINTKILLALTDISSLSAELDCEGERVDLIANYVDGINSNKNNQLVIGSILIGAAASVASGVIKNDNWGNGISIGSGLVGGILGLITLNPKGKKVYFYHSRNILRDVWQESNENKNFPPFVWYMLTEKHFSNSGKYTLLETEKKRWLEYIFDGNKKNADHSIIFSNGGIYRANDLHSRAQMINQMQSVVRSINQQVNYLLIEVESNLL